MTAIQFVTDLLARGRCCFSTQEAVQALGTSMIAARAGSVACEKRATLPCPARGFMSFYRIRKGRHPSMGLAWNQGGREPARRQVEAREYRSNESVKT